MEFNLINPIAERKTKTAAKFGVSCQFTSKQCMQEVSGLEEFPRRYLPKPRQMVYNRKDQIICSLNACAMECMQAFRKWMHV